MKSSARRFKITIPVFFVFYRDGEEEGMQEQVETLLDTIEDERWNLCGLLPECDNLMVNEDDPVSNMIEEI